MTVNGRSRRLCHMNTCRPHYRSRGWADSCPKKCCYAENAGEHSREIRDNDCYLSANNVADLDAGRGARSKPIHDVPASCGVLDQCAPFDCSLGFILSLSHYLGISPYRNLVSHIFGSLHIFFYLCQVIVSDIYVFLHISHIAFPTYLLLFTTAYLQLFTSLSTLHIYCSSYSSFSFFTFMQSPQFASNLKNLSTILLTATHRFPSPNTTNFLSLPKPQHSISSFAPAHIRGSRGHADFLHATAISTVFHFPPHIYHTFNTVFLIKLRTITKKNV